MKYNKNVKKYINDCKYLFASYGKSEKEYMNKLIENIDDGSHDITYDEILERLGTPKETIINYYNQKDMEILIQKAKIKKFSRIILSILVGILLIFLCFKAYIYQKTYDEVNNSTDGYFEETTEVIQ